MFERKFKALILKFLGEFIEDFDDNDLRVDNWSGQVTQTRLNLRPGSLRFLSMVLGIDLRVVRGVIGSLQISFNWRSLWKEAIKLTLEDLYIVARPNTPPDPFIFLATRRNKKRARIEELLLKTKIENPNKTYFQQLEATIADNLCVSLKNVHIRFEDTVSNQFRPFVIGFTLDKLNYSPADSNWKKSFVTLESKKQAGKSFMVLELSQLSVYHISKCTELFSTKSEWLQGLSNDKFASLMYPYIAHRDYTPQISEYYILRPLNAEIRIRISLKSVIDLDIPKLSVSILIEEIACALEANQYQDLLMLGSIMSLHKAIGVNIHLRPVLRPKARTRDWWIYLLSVIKQKVKKKIFPLTWEYLNIRKCNKIEYIQTYQHILAKEYEIEYGRSIGNFQKISGLSNLSIKELENKLLVVEDFHTVEEIYLFRSVAQREMLLLKDSKRKGWIEWGRGWFTSNSAEEENFLKSLVEYFELINTDQKGSADYTKSFINFELKKCSISLEGRHVNGTRASFLKISLYQAIIHRIMTTESTRIFSALISLKIIDPFTPIDKFRKLFNPKNTDESILENIPSFEIEEEIFPVENDGFPDFATQELKITPLFQLVFDATKSKDMSLKVLLQPLEFVYNKFCIERINGFLKIPEALALYESIEIQTMNHLANWKLKTQARLDFLLKNQMKINIDVNISAPLIIIPENTMNEDTSEILLNTGDLRITSKPRDYSEVTYKNRKNSDIDDETFYDHFDIQISDISVSLLPPESIVPWNIIEKFNISMQASKSIIPKDPHLTTLKLKGEIQSLTARLSKMQYLLLQQYSFNTEEAKQEPLVEYKFPAIIDDPEDEFFDAPDPYEDIVTENIKHPYNKEHFRIEFSFNSMNLIITDESEDKDILTVTAKDLVVGASQEESRNVFALKLGYVLVKDWIEKRALVQSNQETSDLIIMDFNKYFDNHPDYIQQNFHTTFSVHLSDLHINYCDEPIRFILSLFQIQSPSIPRINSNFYGTVQLSNVSCKITDGSRDISELHLQSANVCLDSSQNLSAEIGQVTIKDYIRNILFFETLDTSLLSIKIYQKNSEKSLECYINSYKIIMATNMIFNLSDLYEKSVLKNYIKLEKKQETKFNYIKLEINHPLFEFFCSYGLQGSCVIDLGKVSLYQELKHVDLSVTGSNIYTLVTHNEELYKEVVLYDFEISLDADMHIVNVRIPSISLASSLAQVKFIKKLWNEYSANFVQLQHVFNKPHTVSGPVQEKKEISEQLAHGCTYYQETLKLNLSLGKLMLIWTTNFTNNAENRDSVRLEACLNNIQSDCIQVQDTLSVKCKIQSITLQFNLIETLYVLFPHSGNLFVANLQINPSKNVIDVNFNCPRVIITPKTVQVLMILKEEFNSLIVPSPSNNSSNVISGEIKNLQVIITNDGTITIDEEFVEAAIEHEQKRFYMIQFSNVFQEFSCKFQEFFIVTGKTSKFVDDITGKYILHPVDFLVTYENCFKVVISEVNIDFSLSQVPYFTEVYQQFSLIQSQPSENIKYTQFEMELEVQQLLISISHDFSISRNSTNTYFIFQLDFPSIIKSGTVNFTTTLEIFYYNQQYFDWEPFLEKSEVSVTYSQQGKLKRIELKSSDQINFNISSGLISTFSNFWRGIQQHNILENISLMSPNLINRINSGFAIRNETGQKLKYWIDGRVHSLSNWEEESLDFEEVEEEQAAPVIMFKNNQKTRKAYRIKTISVKIGDQGKINDICIDKLGCKLYNIAQQGSHYQVICEVSSRHGDNVLTIRSPIQLKNLLREPIDIRLIFPLAQNKLNEEDYSSTINVPPLSTVPLPIGSSYFTEFQLRIRGYGWSSRKGINNPDPIVIECPHKPINSYDLQSSRKRENSDDIKIAFAVFKQSQVELKDDTEKFSVKLYSFESPFIIENCLCCDLEYQCVSYQTSNKAHGLLRRGESFNWLEITPHAKILLSLRITGYDWTPFLEVLEESKQIYQFSKKYSEQVNVLLEASKKEGMFKLVFFAQYWLENHTGLPLLFKYMENELNYDIISLPYVIEGVYIEERNEKKKGQLNSMFAAFGEKLDIDEEEDIKPWMRYKTDKKIGLGSLLNDEEVSDEGQGTIRMFSSDISNPIKGFVSIKLANSSWSKVFRLVGNEGKKDLLTVSGHSIQAFEESKSRRSCIYEVAMTMQIAEDPFSRTKIIRFTSRFVMINKMPSVLLISQHEPNLDLSGVCRLIPNERSAYHWTDQLKSRSICVRPESYGWQWSGHFYIEGPDDFVMRIRNIHTHEEILIHITITLEDSTLHIIYQDISHMPPYRIENLSMETLLISQINSKVSDKILKPFEVCGYAWDEPTLKKILKVSLHMQGNNSSIHIRDFKIDSQKDLEKINLKPHGSHPSHPLYVEVTNSGSTKVLVFRHELKEEDDVKQNREFNSDDLSVIINFGYIGISIINSSPEEIIYASFLDVKFQLDKSYSEVSGDFRITSGQIDNQLYRAINPVMLSMLENNADLINISFNKRQTTISNQEIDYFKYLKLAIAPIDIKIDGWIVEQLVEFFLDISDLISPVSYIQIFSKDQETEKKSFQHYYFDKVLISKISVNISFESMPFMFKNIDILSPIRMIFIIFGNVGNVFLEFEPLRFYQRHLTMPIIKREISSFYIGQCKNQVINILASSDAIGNPNELIRNLRSGVVDLITLSGELSITGLFKGMKSFFRHSIFGASNSMSKLFESFKKGMYTIYLDESKERGVLSNLLMASTRTALLLPNIVIAMASSTANHIRDAVQQQHYLLRKRPPRSFLSSRVLSVYSYSESVGQYVLSMVDHGRYLSEGIKYHVSLKDSVIVVTSKRVLCAVVEEYKPNWEIKILSITITKLVNETLQIYYVKDDSPGFLQEKVQIIGLNEELEKLKQVIISLQT